MKSKSKKTHSATNVIEAIESLSAIADFGFEPPVENPREEARKEASPIMETRNIQWLRESKEGHAYIKKIFGTILAYLKNFYKTEHSYITDPQTLEGIKAIMTLVGDAAKKIDQTGAAEGKERGSITQLKEYKQLKDFYQTRISHQIDEGVLSKWILGLSQNRALISDKQISATQLEETPHHLFVNLEAVKKDSEYDLFFIRKEDGSHFFSPRLLRNIKLICDFSGGDYGKDPLLEMPVWVDLQLHNVAKSILRVNHEQIEMFYHDAFKFRHRELVALLHKSLMALLLAANPKNHRSELELTENQKTSQEYYLDFQQFIREALHCEDYHKLLVASKEKKQGLNSLLLELLHNICRAFYLSLDRFHDFEDTLDQLFKLAEGRKVFSVTSEQQLVKLIEEEYRSICNLFKSHSRGPMVKILEILDEGFKDGFDPFTQLNLPSQLYNLAWGGHKIANIHLPSPTYQEFIHRANIVEEFKGFLRHCEIEFPLHRHLLINLQDRTSWREHARTLALEDLRTHEDMDKVLTVITLAKDTDFYHQLPPYQQENHAHIFIKQFKDHLGDEASGYYFPSKFKSAVLSEFADEAMEAIHRIFFSNKNSLSQADRLNFIEIFDTFLLLKLIDVVHPDSFSLTCKDGVDIASSCNGLLFLFLKLTGQEPIDQEAWDEFNKIVYAPAILIRERPVAKERFERMAGALRVIEFVYHEQGHDNFRKMLEVAFGHLYESSIFGGDVIVS